MNGFGSFTMKNTVKNVCITPDDAYQVLNHRFLLRKSNGMYAPLFDSFTSFRLFMGQFRAQCKQNQTWRNLWTGNEWSLEEKGNFSVIKRVIKKYPSKFVWNSFQKLEVIIVHYECNSVSIRTLRAPGNLKTNIFEKFLEVEVFYGRTIWQQNTHMFKRCFY